MAEQSEETAVVTTEVTSEPPAPPKAQLMVGKGGIEFSDLEGLYRYSEMVVKTSLCPNDVLMYKDENGKMVRRTPENAAVEALVRIQMGLEVGLKPMFALRNVAVINGRPSIWGNGLRALVQSNPQCEQYSEGFTGEEGTNDFAAFCTIKRTGHEPMTMTFSKQDAITAGLWGVNVWKKFPKDMMRGKAMSRCCQATFADALGGLMWDEDAKEIKRSEDRIDVTPTGDPTTAKPNSLEALQETLEHDKTPDDAPETDDQDGPETPDPDPAPDPAPETEESPVEGENVPRPEQGSPEEGVDPVPSGDAVDGEENGGEEPAEASSYEGYAECTKCAAMFLEDAGELDENGICSTCRPKPKTKRKAKP